MQPRVNRCSIEQVSAFWRRSDRGAVMTVTVFVWDMFRRGPDGSRGVGHASMLVNGKYGTCYVSLWPEEHTLAAGLSSPAKVHFMNGDRLADGVPSWASKPLENLDEKAIIAWWGSIQRDPLIDYSKKKPFQTASAPDQAFQSATNTQYRILNNQCSTAVVRGLLAGADLLFSAKIIAWLALNGVHIGPATLSQPLSAVLRILGVISPTDVKELIVSVWDDF